MGGQHSSNFNPMYQSSVVHSPLSARASETNEAPRIPARKNNSNNSVGPTDGVKSSVYWDPEEVRFVSSASRTIGGSSSATELTYSGQSIFFGGPLVNEQLNRSGRSTGQPQRSSTASYYQQGRSQRGGQLPVFVPSDSQQQQNEVSSNLE
ncbi:protein S-acyltransferase [Salvia divinorum]|uniref:Protein S-acyltransferase n=1 Tax=Salvia divinorum TaxID=28513 RepID=A0ABD1FNI5_SALDI